MERLKYFKQLVKLSYMLGVFNIHEIPNFLFSDKNWKEIKIILKTVRYLKKTYKISVSGYISNLGYLLCVELPQETHHLINMSELFLLNDFTYGQNLYFFYIHDEVKLRDIHEINPLLN